MWSVPVLSRKHYISLCYSETVAYLKCLRCIFCDRSFPPKNLFTCPHCGIIGVLDAAFDYESIAQVVWSAFGYSNQYLAKMKSRTFCDDEYAKTAEIDTALLEQRDLA